MRISARRWYSGDQASHVQVNSNAYRCLYNNCNSGEACSSAAVGARSGGEHVTPKGAVTCGASSSPAATNRAYVASPDIKRSLPSTGSRLQD